MVIKMRKTTTGRISIICAAALLLAALLPTGALAASANSSNEDYIGKAKAKSIALSDAGLSEKNVRRLKAKLEREHRTMVYEVEFKSGRMEYEYEIDAASGAILQSDAEYDD